MVQIETQKLILTMPKYWHEKLSEAAEKEHYVSVQALIYELIRKNYLVPHTHKAGRPKEKTFEDFFAGKKKR